MMTLFDEAKQRDERLLTIIKTARSACERLRAVRPDDPDLSAVLKATLSDLQYIEAEARKMFPNVAGAKL